MLGTNVESKSRCQDLEAVASRAAELGARYEGRLEQLDTYFQVERGRLKLREVSHHFPDGRVSESSELIRYERPNERGARVSTYERTAIEDVRARKAQLEEVHGVQGCVRKRRTLWILDATRIHLDEVEDLGSFVELETVSERQPTAAAHLEHERVRGGLGLDPGETVAGSYIDLLEPGTA